MKRRYVFALAAAVTTCAGAQELNIGTIAIEMDPVDANVLFRKDKNDTSYFRGAVIDEDGQRLPARIGTKGGFSQGFDKRPLMIKLDKPHSFEGQSRIVLNSMGVDRSAMREVLAWDLIHKLGMVAPPTGYRFVTVNGEDRGLFFQVGWIGGDLFEAHGLGSVGEMYDPVDAISCADLSLASVRDARRCWDKIFPGDGNYDSLKALVLGIDREPIETFDQFAERTFHLNSVINWIVITAITSNTQTYNDEYFLFLSKKTGKWLLIPWSYDRSFGWNYEFSVPEPAASDNENFQYYYPLELGALNPLRDKLFNNPQTRRMIEERLAEIVLGKGDKPWSGWFTPKQMSARIDRVLEARAPFLARDPFVGPNIREVHQKVEAIRHYSEARHHYFRKVTLGETEWIRDRATARLPRAGGRITLTDGWGFQLAGLDVDAPAKRGSVGIQVRRRRPSIAPAGVDRRACVYRTWILNTTSAIETDLELEYLEENQRMSELGRRVKEGWNLKLYVHDRSGWREQPAELNTLSNVFRTRMWLDPREEYWFVACQPTPPLAANR